jgi:nitric oxide reductase NorE protein
VHPTAVQPDFSKPLQPPGGVMVWVLISMELLAFGLAFIVFFVLRAKSLSVFASSQALLNQPLALLNTLVLVTSGYCLVVANGAYERGDRRNVVRWMLVTMALGAVFVIVKAVEYEDKIAHGLTTGVNQFFDFYWLLTVFHLFHVLLGLVLLAYMARKVAKGDAFAAEDFNLKTGSAFWHMCDLIWVLLFPILYLI